MFNYRMKTELPLEFVAYVPSDMGGGELGVFDDLERANEEAHKHMVATGNPAYVMPRIKENDNDR